VLTVTQPAVGGIAPQTRYSYTALQAYVKNSGGSIVASGISAYRLTGSSACRTTASCAGGADEVKSTIAYGSTGVANNLLPTSMSSGSGDGLLTATSSATYDAVGNLFTTTDPLSRVTRYRYDADREVVGSVAPDPDGAGALKNRAQRLTYNGDGNVTLAEQGTVLSQSDADWANFATLQQVATTFDSVGRKAQDASKASGTTYAVAQYSYDAASRLDCAVQRMNPAVFGSLPAACTLGTTGSFGSDRISKTIYDAADEVTQAQTGYGTPLVRNEMTATYNVNGTQATLADAKNNLTAYFYDGFDRLSKTEYPSPTAAGTSSTTDYEQLGYDPAGNVTSRRLRDGNSIGYTYDVLNRRTFMDLPATGITSDSDVTYSYDLVGHLLQAIDTNSHRATYTYDALGRGLSEASPWATKSMQYDLAGRRTRLTWQDGFYVSYDYDNVDEMTAIHENGGTTLAGFGYDDLGQRTSRMLANGTSTSYGFDPISRLTSLSLAGGTNANAITLSSYSPAGEIGSRVASNDALAWTQGANANRGYVPNGLNQYSTIAGATQGYDSKGNMTSSGGVTYAYNSKNQLSTGGGNSFYYDPIGRMDQASGSSVLFDYDGANMISELNTSTAAILRRYVFGPSGDEPIVWYEGAGTTTKRYMDQDERGSVTRITDASGATVALNSYDEYGIPASTNQGRFQYTGQSWLAEIGMYNYKARIYSPTLGRFMQTDPIGYGDGPNWYNYVGSNPVNLVDPLGLDKCPAGADCNPDDIYVPAKVPHQNAPGENSYTNVHLANPGSLPGLDPSQLRIHNLLKRILPQNNPAPRCPPPDSPDGIARARGQTISNVAGTAASAAAIAGAVPSPATPFLEAGAAGLKGAALAGTLYQFGADVHYAYDTGQTGALFGDAFGDIIGFIPGGTLAEKFNGTPAPSLAAKRSLDAGGGILNIFIDACNP
jgi:RHS repeat-associated protein